MDNKNISEGNNNAAENNPADEGNNNNAAENNPADEGPPCRFCQSIPCLLEQGLYDFMVLFESQFRESDFDGTLTNKCMRYNLYRQATAWIHGHLGKGRRIEIPQCVRTEILDMAPESNGEYVGFREAAD
jgi:hypothetical protein